MIRIAAALPPLFVLLAFARARNRSFPGSAKVLRAEFQAELSSQPDTTMVSKDGSTFIRLSRNKLDLARCVSRVTEASCGAIATFLGTTRSSFNGRPVISLEYEAYESMALNEMLRCANLARTVYPELHGIVIEHKLGACPVAETSIIIVAASPHRQDALAAVAMMVRACLL